jgi:hypothetical protein
MNAPAAAAALRALADAIEEAAKPSPASGELVTLKEAGRRLGGDAKPLHSSTVARMRARGLLLGVGEGKRTRIYAGSIEAARR